MREKVYVDRLFAEYEDSQEIKDFKEEVVANLRDRVQDFLKEGMSAELAFEQATAELGDITQIADHIGKARRNEAIGDMYLTGVKVNKTHAAGYAVGVLMLLIGLLGLLSYALGYTANIGNYTLITVLLVISVGALTFLGLTQETRANYPMPAKRATAYGIIAAGLTLGVLLAYLLYSLNNELLTVIGVFLACIVPFSGILLYMILTEKKRHKPWVSNQINREQNLHMAYSFADPVRATRFGVASGALWTLAFAILVTVGIYLGWKHAWLVFLFAVPIQLLMLMGIFTDKNKDKITKQNGDY